ncbi:MAG: hypothetical protein ABFD69_03010 [Candidatus Sumerlaeia bacterium]
MTKIENDSPNRLGISGFLRRHWSAVLRVAIYGFLAACMMVALWSLFYPFSEPEAIRRVKTEAPRAIASNSVTTATVIVASSDLPTTYPTMQVYDMALARMVTVQPFAISKLKTDEEKLDAINKRAAMIRLRIDSIGLISQADYAKANLAIAEINTELDFVFREAQMRDYFRIGKPVGRHTDERNLSDSIKRGLQAFNELKNEVAERELEHFVRHGHWAAAAKMCEYRGDYVQSIYYWRKSGGYDGRVRCVLSGISVPLKGTGFNQSHSNQRKTIPDRLYFVSLPKEDETLYMQMTFK